jgi:hypothetical protein
LWRIDPLLGKELETSNETTAIIMQRRGKHASTKIVLQLESVMQSVARQLQQLDYNNGKEVFSMRFVPRSNIEDN